MPCPPRMLGCRRGCRHKAMVTEYRAARHAAVLARESATASYPSETAAYGPIVTFRSWLLALAGGACYE